MNECRALFQRRHLRPRQDPSVKPVFVASAAVVRQEFFECRASPFASNLVGKLRKHLRHLHVPAPLAFIHHHGGECRSHGLCARTNMPLVLHCHAFGRTLLAETRRTRGDNVAIPNYRCSERRQAVLLPDGFEGLIHRSWRRRKGRKKSNGGNQDRHGGCRDDGTHGIAQRPG